MVAKAKPVQETRRVYVDLTMAQDDMLRKLAFDARIPKKRYLELLIEREVKTQKAKK